MKRWSSATALDKGCAFDPKHVIHRGDRVVIVETAFWSKVYCAACGVARQGAPPDTGEVLEVTDSAAFPAALRARQEETASAYEFTGVTKALPFDAKAAAAGKDA